MAQPEVEPSGQWADSRQRTLRGVRAEGISRVSPVMRQLNLFVGGMSCRRCVREVTARLRDVLGVETVSANPGDCVLRGVIC